MTEQRVEEIQAVMREAGVGAWLLYNFRDSNAIASTILGLAPGTHQTRRWAVLIPAEGEVKGLVHRIEPHLGRAIPGTVIAYSSRTEFEAGLQSILSGVDRVVMEYSPNNALPVVSRVDAGTVELIRGMGVTVESSGELIAWLESRLSQAGIDSADRAGAACREIMMSAFGLIRDRINAGESINEHEVVRSILADLERHGLVTDHDPNCSVGPNSANPHYQPTQESAVPIERGSFVLIDLWGKEKEAGSVFGDITWTGYVGESVPEEYKRMFEIVRDARDASFELVRDAFAQGKQVTGAELDDAARNVIESAGYGEYFVHRTGHSITTELHGAGTNLDNFETTDDRPILAGTSFSIEPGIYVPEKFGVRSELDVVIDLNGNVRATSEPLQTEVIPILASDWK